MLTATALAAIRGYQQFISPYKGFCCAYRVHTGKASCSAFGYRAISRFGVWNGIGVLKKRLALCGDVFRNAVQNLKTATLRQQHASNNWQHKGFANRQRGDCDPGCADFLVPDIDCGHFGRAGCELLSNCGSCDWPRSKKSPKESK